MTARNASAAIIGAGDFIGAAFIIAFARGVTVVMNNAGITDTVLHSLESLVTGLSGAIFAMMMFIVNIPLAFLIPSSSGHATLAMPLTRSSREASSRQSTSSSPTSKRLGTSCTRRASMWTTRRRRRRSYS